MSIFFLLGVNKPERSIFDIPTVICSKMNISQDHIQQTKLPYVESEFCEDLPLEQIDSRVVSDAEMSKKVEFVKGKHKEKENLYEVPPLKYLSDSKIKSKRNDEEISTTVEGSLLQHIEDSSMCCNDTSHESTLCEYNEEYKTMHVNPPTVATNETETMHDINTRSESDERNTGRYESVNENKTESELPHEKYIVIHNRTTNSEQPKIICENNTPNDGIVFIASNQAKINSNEVEKTISTDHQKKALDQINSGPQVVDRTTIEDTEQRVERVDKETLPISIPQERGDQITSDFSSTLLEAKSFGEQSAQINDEDFIQSPCFEEEVSFGNMDQYTMTKLCSPIQIDTADTNIRM